MLFNENDIQNIYYSNCYVNFWHSGEHYPFAFVLSTTNDTIVNQGNMHLDEEKLCNQEIQMEH
jgi:hypothetical protein